VLQLFLSQKVSQLQSVADVANAKLQHTDKALSAAHGEIAALTEKNDELTAIST